MREKGEGGGETEDAKIEATITFSCGWFAGLLNDVQTSLIKKIK